MGFALAIAVGQVLPEHGLPAVETWRDYLHVKKALIRLIYRENQP